MNYKVFVSIPYEGEVSEWFNSLDEVKAFIQSSNYRWDDVEVYQIAKHIDVYALMKESV